MLNLIFRKYDLFFLKKKLASSRGAPQENDAKFRFAIYPQGIGQFHDNYQIAKCQTDATLALVSCLCMHYKLTFILKKSLNFINY